MCVCVCVYVFVYICVCVYICVYMYVCVYVFVCMHECVYELSYAGSCQYNSTHLFYVQMRVKVESNSVLWTDHWHLGSMMEASHNVCYSGIMKKIQQPVGNQIHI